MNPNTKLDLVNSAERAAAKREVERIRKKLLEGASKLLGGAASGEACVVSVAQREESQAETKHQDQQKPRGGHEETADSGDTAIWDWA